MKGITLPTLQIAAVAFLVITCQAAPIVNTNSEVEGSNLGPRNPDIGSTIDGAIQVQENAVLARSDDVLEKRKDKNKGQDQQPQQQQQPPSPSVDSHDKSFTVSPKVSISKVGGKAGENVAKKVGEKVGETVLKDGVKLLGSILV